MAAYSVCVVLWSALGIWLMLCEAVCVIPGFSRVAGVEKGGHRQQTRAGKCVCVCMCVCPCTLVCVSVCKDGGGEEKERDSWVLIEPVPSHQTQTTQHHNYLNPHLLIHKSHQPAFFFSFFAFTDRKRKHQRSNDQINSRCTWAAMHLAAVAKVFRATWYGPGVRQVASPPPFFTPVHSCSGQHLIKTSKLPVTNLE